MTMAFAHNAKRCANAGPGGLDVGNWHVTDFGAARRNVCLSLDTVVKVVLHWGSEILRAAGATFV
jgi:hypothetical protein